MITYILIRVFRYAEYRVKAKQRILNAITFQEIANTVRLGDNISVIIPDAIISGMAVHNSRMTDT